MPNTYTSTFPGHKHGNHIPGGTRFRIFPQAPLTDRMPPLETVTVSSPAGSLGPGPSDDRMYAIVPLGGPTPYGVTPGRRGMELNLPPWRGSIVPPAAPSPAGHFDHVPVTSPQFPAVHMFGVARFTLDVWERYLGGPVAWHFDDLLDRLELSTVPGWRNAQMGFGFLQAGERPGPDGLIDEYALNFDVIAHEIGHALLLALEGPFDRHAGTWDYEAFHEMSSDWVALITLLHLDTVVDALLDGTSGNLDTYNQLSRFAELSDNEQIRLANNKLTLDDFRDGWHDEHDIAKPLIGAFFDYFIDLYHELLVERGAISPELEMLADAAERDPALLDDVQRGFEAAYAARRGEFRRALDDARDMAAMVMIDLWGSVDPERDVFADIAAFFETRNLGASEADRIHARIARTQLERRGIGRVPLGPRFEEPPHDSHTRSSRLVLPVG